jgi:hypothetical protein
MRTSTIRRGGVLKKLLIALVLVVVLAPVAIVLFIDPIAKAGIAAAGSHALGTKTRVDEAAIGLFSGKTAIRGLAIDNPKGYSPEKFVTLGEISVDAGLPSFLGEKIVIDRVAIRELAIEIEKGPDGVLNVKKFAEHMQKVTGRGAPSDTPPPPADGEAKEVLVKELRLESMTVNLRNIAGGRDGVVPVVLPDIVIRDLSSKGGVDVLASELSGVVIGAAMKGVIAANIEGLGADVVGGLQGAVEGIGGAIGGSLRGAVDVGISGAGDAIKGVGKAMGDLGAKVIEGAGDKLKEGVGGALEGIFGGKK